MRWADVRRLVSGESISVMRDGKVIQLHGTELERVRKWVVERAEKTRTADRGPGR